MTKNFGNGLNNEVVVMNEASARSALIVVDVQNDFCEGGALGVDGGCTVAACVAPFVKEHREDYALVIASRGTISAARARAWSSSCFHSR